MHVIYVNKNNSILKLTKLNTECKLLYYAFWNRIHKLSFNLYSNVISNKTCTI